MAKPTATASSTVYPIGSETFLEGIPLAPISAPADVADRLVATGAYSARSVGTQPDPVELTEDQIARLDFYHMPEDAPTPTESAVPAGVDETPATEEPPA